MKSEDGARKRGPGRPVKGASAGLGEVVQDYLKAIFYLQSHPGEGHAAHRRQEEREVSVTSLAERLDVAASTVSVQVQKLAAENLAHYRPYRGVTLTEQGRLEALRVIRKHRLVECLLVQVLGYSWDEVHEEAEILEHAVSDRFVERIDALMGHPRVDPHGAPIPSASGEFNCGVDGTLDDVEVGACCRVLRVKDDSAELLRFLQEAGVVPGAQVELVSKQQATGVLEVSVQNGARVSLSTASARKIWVALARD